MNIFPAWLSAEVQARIEPPPILLINKDPPEANEYEILKINMRQNSSDAALETYELNIVTFEHGQPEEFLQLMKNFKREVERTGTTTAVGKINHLHTLLRGEELKEFNKLASHNSGMNVAHLKFFQKGLLVYFPSINDLSKKKRTMCHAMRKPWYLPLKRFAACLTELNNYLPLFQRSSASKKIPPE